jgi:DNA uptake protein ComE-like DNA-binding protein
MKTMDAKQRAALLHSPCRRLAMSIGLALSVVFTMPAFAAVNLNTATQAELEAVKGIGPSKASAAKLKDQFVVPGDR